MFTMSDNVVIGPLLGIIFGIVLILALYQYGVL